MTEYVAPDSADALPRWVTLCGTLAPMSSILMYLSPIPTIRQVLRTGTVGDLPLLPYTSMVASCFVWIVYGILKREPTIWCTNIVELTLSLYYFVEFTNYAPKQSPTFPGSVYRHIQFCGAIWFLSLWMAIFLENNVSAVGDLTVTLTALTFASPLAAVKAVVESQSSESIPWPFTIAALVNCCLWSVVGVFEMHDVYVYFPELSGLFFGLVQVALKLYYGDHNSDNDSNPTYMRAPVEMPYPVLGSVRQVVMLGNNYLNQSHNPFHGNSVEDHDLQFDTNMSGGNSDYVQLGVPLTGGGGGENLRTDTESGITIGGHGPHQKQQQQYHPQQQQQQQQQHHHHHGGPQVSTSGADMSGQQFSFAHSPFHHHKHNKSNEGLKSVVFENEHNNPSSASGVEGPALPHPTPPATESFRSRSGSAGHPPFAHGH